MSAYSNQGSNNRSRGGRRRPRRGNGNRSSSSTNSSSSYRPGGNRSSGSASQKPKKKSLWQKIVSFFSGKSQSAPHAGKNGHVAADTAAPAETKERTSSAQSPRPIRKPEPIEVTSGRIYVGNLSFDASESDLSELFSGVGSVQNVEIVFNKHTHRSKGFGFIQMQSVEEAKRAVEELHDKEYMGRKLVVSGAKAAPESRPARGQQEDDAAPEEEQQSSSAA